MSKSTLHQFKFPMTISFSFCGTLAMTKYLNARLPGPAEPMYTRSQQHWHPSSQQLAVFSLLQGWHPHFCFIDMHCVLLGFSFLLPLGCYSLPSTLSYLYIFSFFPWGCLFSLRKLHHKRQKGLVSREYRKGHTTSAIQGTGFPYLAL